MAKRVFDICFSLLALLILLPLLAIIALWVRVDSKGPVFYFQTRVGKNDHDFKLFKFRTMRPDADKHGLLTVGGRDSRVTRLGYYLRKFKVDELPQLLNVLLGQMSMVGPRPEVRKYTSLYTSEQKKVLSVKPGITDYASIKYFQESELLAKAVNPEETYIHDIMPVKLKLNLYYIQKQSFVRDIKIIAATVLKILK